ncbi:MAG: class I SAM-dependent methyltransferase [Candidatus Sericytochromatia bacterium]
MADTGALFYDNPSVFATYSDRRQQATSANDTLELPIFQSLLPPVDNLDVIDLGCGDAALARELFAQGLRSYLGVDGSHRMIELAQQVTAGTPARLEQDYLETWDAAPECCDLILSRLAFHYVEDPAPVFARMARALRPGGHVVLSVEHPVITSHQVSMKQGANRQDWVVDRYFETGMRKVSWLGGEVLKYHRTVEDYFTGLQDAGLVVESLRESRPNPKLFKDKRLLEKRSRVPLFLFLRARKN